MHTGLNIVVVGASLALLGAVGFIAVEPTMPSFLDALYLTVATLTTVGYGDFSPTTPASRLLMVFIALGGMSFFCGPLLDQTGSWAKLLRVTPDSSALNNPRAEDLALLVTVGVTVGSGTATFVLLEGWTIIDAMYFCFITGTTVGYGDHDVFKTDAGEGSSTTPSSFLHIFIVPVLM